MRKLIVIPEDLKAAIDLFKDAMNLAYINGLSPRRRVRLKKANFDKEYSFSATLCYLAQYGLAKQYEINNPHASLFANKADFIKYKQLIEAAYQKSLDFDIDKPHRRKRLLNE